MHAAGTLFGWVLFRLSGVGDPVGFVVHTSAFTAHRSAIPGKLWFLGNFNSNIGHYNMCRWGGVICRPVIAERGLSGASHLVGLTVEGWHSQTTCTAMPGKLCFPRNRGTNMTDKNSAEVDIAPASGKVNRP